MIWMPSKSGRAVDLMAPRADQVDFRDIAEVLARLNRYAGNAIKQVSVAQHTLIVCDACEIWLKPYALLHDAHEARIGDITTPVVAALDAIACEQAERAKVRAASLPGQALRELKHRHDMAIHMAAGLMVPTEAQVAGVNYADLVALQTERRDFLAKSERPWEIDGVTPPIAPLRKVYRLRAPEAVADELYARFRQHLPVFAAARPACERV